MNGVPYTVRGLTLECEFEFEAGEPQTLGRTGLAGHLHAYGRMA
jgi:hypothetical protein